MITERLMKAGEWNLALTDPSLDDDIAYFDHVVVVPGNVSRPAVLDDASILSIAAYVGVVRKKTKSADRQSERLFLGGNGSAIWLGDEDEKGHVIESARSYTAASLAAVLDSATPPYGLLRDDSGGLTPIRAGTLFSVAGTYTGEHVYQSQRSAIDYVVGLFDAEWRINPDFTIDVGLESDLFVTTPVAVIARSAGDGRDPAFEGVPLAGFDADRDVFDYTTRVVVLAEGSGQTIAVGAANAGSVPYLDPHGNPIVRTRLVNESETASGNANSRAQLHLNRFSGLRKALKIDLAEFDIHGSWNVGDTVFVYDETSEDLVDTTNEIRFRGRVLHPVAIRVVGHSWPVTDGMSVFARRGGGTYIDLTDHVVFETGDPSVELGAAPRSTRASSDPAVTGVRVNPGTGADDNSVPATPTKTNLPWATLSYVDAQGVTRAQILAEWLQPLNTDSSTVTDGSHYDVRWRRSGVTEYQNSTVPWGVESFVINDLSPGVTYEIGVQAVDTNGNQSGYGTDETVTASPDTTAPSTPAAPTVAGNPLFIQVSHDLGKATGGTFNLESDLDHLKVHVGTSAGFTPDASNHVGDIPATAANLALGIPAIATYEILDTSPRYVKVAAVDRSGNTSTYSAASAAQSATLIDTAHITDLAVTNAKIATLSASKLTAGTIGAHTIELNGASSILRSSNYVAGTSGWQILGDGSAEFNNVTVRGSLGANSIVGNLIMSTGGVLMTAASGARVRLASGAESASITIYSGGGSEADPMQLFALNDTGNPVLFLKGPRNTSYAGPVPELAMDGIDGSAFLRGGGDSGTRPLLSLNSAGVGDVAIFTGGATLGTADLTITSGKLTLSATALTTTIPIRPGPGSAATPSYSFSSQTGMGFFIVDTDAIGLSFSGTARFRFLEPLTTDHGQIRTHYGTAAFPNFNPGGLSGDIDSGYYGVSDGITAISGNGTICAVFDVPNTDIRPGVDNTFNLGNASFRFVDVWAVDTTINSSDRAGKISRSIRPLGFDPERFVRELPVREFKRRGRKRTHTGWIAQDLKSVLDALDVDLAAFVDPTVTGGDGELGIRTGELTAILWAACQRYDERLTALENGGTRD